MDQQNDANWSCWLVIEKVNGKPWTCTQWAFTLKLVSYQDCIFDKLILYHVFNINFFFMFRPVTSSRSLPRVHKKKQPHRRVQSDEGSALVDNDIPYRLPKVGLSQSQPTPRSTVTRRINSSHEPTSHERLYEIDYMGWEPNINYYPSDQ